MKTVVSRKGAILLPAKLMRQDGIKAGQEFEVERINRGNYRLTRRSDSANNGAIEWLLACPVKGFFVPLASELTGALVPGNAGVLPVLANSAET